MPPPAHRRALPTPGRNCWQVARAGRVAWLVDGAAYFGAFAAAAERAEQSILLLGWDVHGGVRLRRDGTADREHGLAPFLGTLVARRPGLAVRVLSWDFALLYVFEREVLPRLRPAWRAHPRLELRLDGHHPLGASHHQKVVVVDDAVAFVGGFDLAACRWDTPAHAAHDARRSDPGFPRYAPFHDVQLMVDGEAAAALGTLARERWHRATGERLPRARGGDRWPPGVAPGLTDVPVAIARTEPPWDGRPGVREIETLLLDAIAATRHGLYVESQYLTSSRIADALAARLREKDGPDIVLVVPRACSGWLEEATMGVLRGRLVTRLRDADRHGRLALVHPVVPGLDAAMLNVHSKVLVADDALLRVGSANLSNRSLGLDTECDLAIAAGDDRRVAEGIARFRDTLLAEHLGRPLEAVAAGVRARGLCRTVEELGGGPRTLIPLVVQPDPWLDELVPAETVVDPDAPPEPTRIVRQVLLGPAGRRAGSRVAAALGVVAALAGFVVAWRITPLGAAMGQALAWMAATREGIVPVAAALAVFVGAGLLMVPVTALVVATVIAFGAVRGGGIALLGTLAVAASGWAVGRALARASRRRAGGAARGGPLRLVARRVLRAAAAGQSAAFTPLAVFALVAGARRVRLGRFLGRLSIALVPAVAAMAATAEQFLRTVRAPGPDTVVGSVVLLLLLVVAAAFLRHGLVPSVAGGGGD